MENRYCRDDSGCLGYLIGIGIVLAIVGVIIYLAVMLAGVIAAVAGVAGLIWGGGTAVWNYGKSFKRHVIDSNRAPA